MARGNLKFRLIRNAFVVNVAKVYLAVHYHAHALSRTRTRTPFTRCSLFPLSNLHAYDFVAVFTCLLRLVGETPRRKPGTSMWISMKTCRRRGDRSPSVFAINSLRSSSVSRKQVDILVFRCIAAAFSTVLARSNTKRITIELPPAASNFCDELQAEEHRD